MNGPTPGPWTWQKGAGSTQRDAQCMKVVVGSNGQGLAWTVGLHEPTDTENARLIAAAPGLYEIVRRVVNQGLLETPDEREAARALLDSIKGKS